MVHCFQERQGEGDDRVRVTIDPEVLLSEGAFIVENPILRFMRWDREGCFDAYAAGEDAALRAAVAREATLFLGRRAIPVYRLFQRAVTRRLAGEMPAPEVLDVILRTEWARLSEEMFRTASARVLEELTRAEALPVFGPDPPAEAPDDVSPHLAQALADRPGGDAVALCTTREYRRTGHPVAARTTT